MSGLRVGLLGGSFNPAHGGHRHISEWALKRLGLDQVWWLVSPQNPLKSSADMATFERRLATAENVAQNPRIRVMDIERHLGTVYTVDTLKALKDRFPTHRFVWMMGADNLLQLPAWRRWTEIMNCMPVAVFDRPTYAYQALSGVAAYRYRHCRVNDPGVLAMRMPPAWCYLRGPTDPVSATGLRQAGAWIAS